MMTRLHARDPEGKWLTGLDACQPLSRLGLHRVVGAVLARAGRGAR
jgi:hypothetical protein